MVELISASDSSIGVEVNSRRSVVGNAEPTKLIHERVVVTLFVDVFVAYSGDQETQSRYFAVSLLP